MLPGPKEPGTAGAPRTLSGKTGTEIRLLLVNTFLLATPKLRETFAPGTVSGALGSAIGEHLVCTFLIFAAVCGVYNVR